MNDNSSEVKIKNPFDPQIKDKVSEEEISGINFSNKNNENKAQQNKSANKDSKSFSGIELVQNNSQAGLLARNNSNKLIKSINNNLNNPKQSDNSSNLISKENSLVKKREQNESNSSIEDPPSCPTKRNIQGKKYSEDKSIEKNFSNRKSIIKKNSSILSMKKNATKRFKNNDDEDLDERRINENLDHRRLTKRDKIVKFFNIFLSFLSAILIRKMMEVILKEKLVALYYLKIPTKELGILLLLCKIIF